MNERYTGLLGWLTEAGDIKEELGCTVAESFEIQRHRAALRAQERAQKIEAAESNVIHVDFVSRTW